MEERPSFETFIGEISLRFINAPLHRMDQEIRKALEATSAHFSFDWAALAERATDRSEFQIVQTTYANKSPGDREIAAWVLSPGYLETIVHAGDLTVTRVRNNSFQRMPADKSSPGEKAHQWIIGLPLVDANPMTGFIAFGKSASEPIVKPALGSALNRVGRLFENVLIRRRTTLQFEELLQFERMLSEISSTFSGVSAESVDRTIESGLAHIGTFLGADYCNLVPFSRKDSSRNVVHSWVREDAAPLPYFDAPLGDLFPWFAEKFRCGQVVHFSRLEDLPADASSDRKEFSRMGTKSHASVPIAVEGSIIGVLSIGTMRGHRSWPEELVQRLRLIGEIFANAMVRKQKQLEIRTAFSQIEKLNAQLKAESTYLRQEIERSMDFHNMIGKSEALKQVIDQVGRIAATDVTVLIHGETGTGKELVARALHAASDRRDRPMVKVNCAALPENLIESELFGHEKGAFTDAINRQIGRFELAHGSTLFLDEIGELPMASQAKLLRVLQESEFERLGSSTTIRVDVRIIAATNRVLEKEVRKGRFRQDLWYRLNVFPIEVPPLRRRSEDIPLLVNWFILKSGKKLAKNIERIPIKVMKALQNYGWPGNVRELENIIERAVINSPHSSLQLLDKLEGPESLTRNISERPTFDEMARNYIVQILEETRGRVEGPNGAAAILGIHPSTLRGRMRKMGIKVSAFIE
jgi:transcriptional regulator with GAF, ATPase, and Fis domain